jgi:hypothetical protein
MARRTSGVSKLGFSFSSKKRPPAPQTAMVAWICVFQVRPAGKQAPNMFFAGLVSFSAAARYSSQVFGSGRPASANRSVRHHSTGHCTP